jgi:glycolate oxidase
LLLTAFEGSPEEVQDAVNDWDAFIGQMGFERMDERSAEAEWKERYYPMRIGRLGPTLLGGETIIPIGQLESVLPAIQSLGHHYHLRIGTETHVISKDWAVVLALYLSDERRPLTYLPALAVIRDIVQIGLAHGGKPYGLGLWQSVYAARILGKEYLQELKAVKKQVDPQGIMNPGKFFRAETRFGIPIAGVPYHLLMSILSLLCRFG